MLYWYSGLGEIDTIAKEKGYSLEEGVPILSVQKEALLKSAAVKKALQVALPGISSAPMADIWSYQYEDILQFLGHRHITMEESRLDEFDGALSQIVFDKNERIRAVLFSTRDQDGIFVDLLLGASNASEYIMMALQGFIKAAMKGGQNEEEKIFMVAAQDVVQMLLRRMLDKKYAIEELGFVHFITLGPEESDPELLSACRQAEKTSVIQQNISWKLPWTETVKAKQE